MEHFKEIVQNIISKIMISSRDSDTDRAQKIIWYAFFGSIILLFIVSSSRMNFNNYQEYKLIIWV